MDSSYVCLNIEDWTGIYIWQFQDFDNPTYSGSIYYVNSVTLTYDVEATNQAVIFGISCAIGVSTSGSGL